MLKHSFNRKAGIIGSTILIILTSFFRDHVFKSVNEQLRLNYYGEAAYDYSFLMPVISSFSSGELNTIKFILTIVFTGVFMLLGLMLCHITFRNKRYNLIVIAGYVMIFLMSLIIYVLGKLLGMAAAGYELSRNITEFLQSPLLVLILMAVFVFDLKRQSATTRNKL